MKITRKLIIVLNISSFHNFLCFYISQGSVATRLRCVGKMTSGLLQISYWIQR